MVMQSKKTQLHEFAVIICKEIKKKKKSLQNNLPEKQQKKQENGVT